MYYNTYFSIYKYFLELTHTIFYIFYYYFISFIDENETEEDIVFYCGYGNIPGEKKKWDGNTLYMGGSENSLITLAEKLSTQYNVKIYNNCAKNITINGVKYVNAKYFNFFKNYNTLIFWRFPIPLLFKKLYIKNAILWLHDGEPLCKFFEIINNTILNRYIYSSLNTLDYIISPSKFLSNHIYNYLRIDIQKLRVIPNFVEKLNSFNEKKKNNIIWHINFNRGLKIILKNWDKIKKLDDNFELHIYGNKNELYINNDFYDDIQLEGVYFYDKLSHDNIMQEIKKFKFFIYPAIIRESFSISTWECLINNCIPIVYDTGAVNEIRDYGGIVVDKNFDEIIKKLKVLLNNKYYNQKVKEINSIDFDFISPENIVKEWIDVIEYSENINTSNDYESIFKELLLTYKNYSLNKYNIYKDKEI